MHPHTQATIKRVITSAKAAVHALGRIMAAPRNSMPANCTNINSLLMHLCDFDQRTYRYLVKWLAYPLCNPGAKMQYAILANGQAGSGAAIFFANVMAAIYAHAARTLNEKEANDRLNAWIHGARFVVIDTHLPAKLAAAIKTLVASPDIAMERQPYGREPIRVKNQMNIVLLSNSENFLPLSACDRRFFVIEVPPKREKIFYDAVLDEINNGGVDAFRDYLLHGVDLTDFNQFSEPPRLAVSGRLAS